MQTTKSTKVNGAPAIELPRKFGPCPECLPVRKMFQHPAALGSHRKILHGVEGASRNGQANRGQAKKERRIKKSKNENQNANLESLASAIAALEIHVQAYQDAIRLLKGMQA